MVGPFRPALMWTFEGRTCAYRGTVALRAVQVTGGALFGGPEGYPAC